VDGLFRFNVFLEWNDSRHQPFVPYIIDLALEVVDIVIDEMRKPSLLDQVVTHWQALESAVGNLLGLAIELLLAGQLMGALCWIVEGAGP